MKKSDLKQFIKEEIKSALSQPIKEGEIPGKIGKIESIINDLGESDLEAIIQYMKEKGRPKAKIDTEVLNKLAANKDASSPPVPALISRIEFFSSLMSFGINNFNRSISKIFN